MLANNHWIVLLSGCLAGLITRDAAAGDHDAWSAAPVAPRASHGPELAVAHDPGHGRPALLWSPAAPAAPTWLSPEAVARLQLERQRTTHGIGSEVIAGARLRLVHDLGRGGKIVVLRSTVAGIDVFHGDIKVLIDRAGRPIATSGAPHPAAHAGSARTFSRDPAASVRVAVGELGGFAPTKAQLAPRTGPAGWSYFELVEGVPLRMREPARARPVYFPRGEALVPAHFVELQGDDHGSLSVVQYVVSADDGSVLYRREATAREAFEYRVWADDDGDHRPTDGPLEDFTPHPTGIPGEGPNEMTKPSLISMEGFNVNPEGAADPWLAPGATETRGNNVDAYVDHTDPDGLVPESGEFRASVTAPNTFDRIYSTALEPLTDADQSMAAITQLFYVTNWLHDDWYASGFDEVAGNAQEVNFGRGGVEGDVLHAEAQDAALIGARNNANMSTPSDGASPTMQMYLWTGRTTAADLTVTPLGDTFDVELAQFGPTNFDIEAPMVLVEDTGDKSPTDGCQMAVNDLAGKIALIDRGDCTFEVKVAFAQAAGAIGVVIADNVDAATPPNLGNDANTQDPTIPAQGTTKATGALLKAALEDGAQTAHMVGATSVERDGTIDNMIVAHEWGHYIHHRLVDCGNNACAAQSEGWGDFVAMHMMLREGDPLAAVYAADTYASFDLTGYFGIRRVPYSVDFTKNALTYRHIADGEALPVGPPIEGSGIPNSEVHNAGEVWATMMWEAYVALHAAHAGQQSFAEVRRLFADYVVAGMILAPPSPTYTEQRDALLMAAAARSLADFTTIAEAFARRGAGSCAVSPPRNSVDFKGVVEDYQLRANGVLLTAVISEGDASCDGDGVIDIGEHGRIDLEFYNGGAAALPAGATIEVVDADPALVFPNGPVVTMPELAPLAKTTASIAVTVAGLTQYRPIAVKLRVTTIDSCNEVAERVLPTVIHADLDANASAVDDVEAEPSVWTLAGGGESVWRRASSEQDGFFWHADDVGRQSDTRLNSPPLMVSEDAPLLIEFDHAFSFEASDGINWDGAVVELTRDAGKTWVDVSTLAAAIPYTGTLASDANPINGRPAFVGQSEGYPTRHTVQLDFGDKLAGETIVLRFRVGTDAAAGAAGWDIDNIGLSGITNTPFPRWQVDQQTCVETGGGDDDSGGTPTTTGTPTGGGPTSDDNDDGGVDSAIDSAGGIDDDGCGCTTGQAPARGSWLALLLLGLRRRTRRE